MPTTTGDTLLNEFAQPTLQDQHTLRTHVLHSGIELEQLGPKSPELADRGPQSPTQTSTIEAEYQRSHSSSPRSLPTAIPRFEGASRIPSPVSSLSSDHSQMYRRNQSSSQSRPSQGAPLPSTNEQQNGHINGRASGEAMDSHLEMRRKHPVLDTPSSSSQSEYLIAREEFTLDDDIPQNLQSGSKSTSFFEIPVEDQKNTMLLVLLYLLQGVPMGLATGSVPFLLKSHLSYGQIGVFSLAAYPYSLKLLWSPIVDAVWTPKLGRRKSWIVPIQIFSGLGMLYLGGNVDKMMELAGASDGSGVWSFTYWWFLLVFLCATQDIAVDGWALTLLTPESISYASTSQTIGLTAGHFLSYTVFLALNSPKFANHWFRTTPADNGILTLNSYLTFWGWAYLLVTLGLVLLKREEKTKTRDGVMEVYKHMGGILKLKPVQSIVIIHLIAKIGFQANEAVTNLKLLDKGFSQEDMALTVLLDFPVEVGLAYYAAKWSMNKHPIRVWSYAFLARLAAAVFAQGVVMLFPKDRVVGTGYLCMVIAQHMFSTVTGTIMFVAIAAFHAKISDPIIGGTYMTLLAT